HVQDRQCRAGSLPNNMASLNKVVCLLFVVLVVASQVQGRRCRGRGCRCCNNRCCDRRGFELDEGQEDLLQARPLRGVLLEALRQSHAKGCVNGVDFDGFAC
ncbi:unnamed protein product, partial [Meganyctiphanes norvegica]